MTAPRYQVATRSGDYEACCTRRTRARTQMARQYANLNKRRNEKNTKEEHKTAGRIEKGSSNFARFPRCGRRWSWLGGGRLPKAVPFAGRQRASGWLLRGQPVPTEAGCTAPPDPAPQHPVRPPPRLANRDSHTNIRTRHARRGPRHAGALVRTGCRTRNQPLPIFVACTRAHVRRRWCLFREVFGRRSLCAAVRRRCSCVVPQPRHVERAVFAICGRRSCFGGGVQPMERRHED